MGGCRKLRMCCALSAGHPMSLINSFPFDSLSPSEQGITRSLRVGTGRAIAHHGELLQGVFPRKDGRLHRALLTLPFPRAESVVTFWPEDKAGIHTRPIGRNKAAKAAMLAFQEFGFSQIGGCLTIESSIPIGCGYGSSTADVVAAIRAVASATGAQLHRSLICRLAVEAEIASDAIVFGEQAVLFAHREGRVLEYFSGDYPPLDIIGFASRDDAPVDTLAFTPARYGSSEIESFRVLRALARRAIRNSDAGLLGQVASASARINQNHLPKKHFTAVLKLAEEVDACGVHVAHSGNLMGILIDATKESSSAQLKFATAAARNLGFTDIVRFSVNGDGVSSWR